MAFKLVFMFCVRFLCGLYLCIVALGLKGDYKWGKIHVFGNA